MTHVSTTSDPRPAMIAEALRRIYRPPPVIKRPDLAKRAEEAQRAKEYA